LSDGTWGSQATINSPNGYYPTYIQTVNGELHIGYRNASGYLVERILVDGTWGSEVTLNAADSAHPTYFQFVDGTLLVAYVIAPNNYLVSRTLRRYAPVQGQGVLREFTPTIYGATTAGSPTYSSRYGQYIIRDEGGVRWCEVIWRIQISAIGGMAGGVRLTLPVPAAAPVSGISHYPATIGYVDNQSLPTNYYSLIAYVYVTDDCLHLMAVGPTNTAELSASGIDANFYIICSCKYPVED
jgi:hypothetical protein